LREAKDADEAGRIWLGRKSAFGAMGQVNDYMCLDGTIPVSELPYVLRRIGELSKEYGLDVGNVFHAGDGNMHPLILYNANTPGDLETCEALGAEILKLCVAPKTEQELATLVANATGPLRISGGGTRPIGRPVDGADLSTRNLSGISLYDPGALTIVAQSGTPIAEIEKALKAENQRLAFEPMGHRALLGTKGTPTIGGVVAGNISGPRRISVGACRDFLLGVRFVDGQGQIIKNGGRVMKNVTGYDLVKLMSGAYGTLGILTDVTGAARTTNGDTMLRIEGFKGSVAYRAEQLQKHLIGFGKTTATENAPDLWQDICNVTAFAQEKGDVWRISVRPSQAAATAAKIGATQLQYDWGGGLIWALVPEGSNVREALGDFQGHATLIRASEDTRAAITPFQPEPAPLAALATNLRAKFDPRGILNPGLMT